MSYFSRRVAHLDVHEALLQFDDIPTEDEEDSEEEDDDSLGLSLIQPQDMTFVANNSDDDDDKSSSDEEERPARTWEKTPKASSENDFKEPEGPVKSFFDHCITADDYFLTFLDPSIRESIIFQTNLYATQNSKRWKPLDDSDLLGFLGINILMGYHKLPAYTHFWSDDRDLGVKIVQETMARDRFASILGNLHLNDNLSMPQGNKDKLYKLRPFIDALNGNFLKLWSPSRNQSIDESMVLFKGRHSIKQYNPMKPIKRGYKLWCRAEMSGYISEFQIYQGKAETTVTPSLGLGGRVVMDLSEKIAGKNHILWFDNFFTSVDLLEQLQDKGTHACGTIRHNRRGLPTLAQDKSLKRGEFDYSTSNSGLSYYKWKDNKAVHMLSNFHGTEAGSVERTEKNGNKVVIACPKAVEAYNSEMGGVDKADMLKSIYGIDRKSKKWWHRLFFHLVDVSIINAYVVYTSLFGKLPVLEFRRKVALGLLTRSQDRKTIRKQGRPSQTISQECNNAKHRRKNISVPVEIRKGGLGIHRVRYVEKRGRCEFCSMDNKESRPYSKCSKCDIFLCSNQNKNCLNDWHDM